MQIWMDAGVILLAYLIGAIPFGLMIVNWQPARMCVRCQRQDRWNQFMRAAGCWAGMCHALFDIFKGIAAVWLARTLSSNIWIEVLAPVAAVLGHKLFHLPRGT